MDPYNDNIITTGSRKPRGGLVVVLVAGLAVVLLAVAAVAASMLSASPAPGDSGSSPPAPPPESPSPQASMLTVGYESTIATSIVSKIKVYEEPSESAPVKAELDIKNENGVDQVFLAKRSQDGWLNVLLPMRPNGSTGWIRIRDVKITGTNYRIKVHVGEKRLELYESGRLLTQFPVGIGKQDTPTPGGDYYIKELIRPIKQNGPYGTFAYGLSGFSNVLESFNGGTGVIGIHGTNDPSGIGKEVSAGCIRLRNEDIEQLVVLLPLGTPVEIIEL